MDAGVLREVRKGQTKRSALGKKEFRTARDLQKPSSLVLLSRFLLSLFCRAVSLLSLLSEVTLHEQKEGF